MSAFEFQMTPGDPIITAQVPAIAGKTADEIERMILADPQCPVTDLTDRHQRSIRDFAEKLAEMYGPGPRDTLPVPPPDPYEQRALKLAELLSKRPAAVWNAPIPQSPEADIASCRCFGCRTIRERQAAPVDPYGKFRAFEERSARLDKTLDQRISAAQVQDDYTGPESLPNWED